MSALCEKCRNHWENHLWLWVATGLHICQSCKWHVVNQLKQECILP